MIRKRLFILLLILCVSLVVRAADGSSPYTNLVYGSGTNTRQILDVFLPTTQADRVPVIFMVHGGGYVFGDKMFVRPAVDFFVAQGFAVVTPSYRLAPSHPYPAPLQDIFCAYAWTLSHAEEYGFDLARVTVMGESAGANAVAMLASVDDPTLYMEGCPHSLPESFTPQAAVMYYAPIDLSTCSCRPAKQLAALYLGLDRYDPTQEAEIRQRGEEASPLPWLDGHEPPFLLFHGTADTLIPVSESELFVEKVTEAGGEAQLIVVQDALHGFFARPAYPQAQESWEQILTFLQNHGVGVD
jgi:acetyl esterase/lipase